jgi:hypothetical protein
MESLVVVLTLLGSVGLSLGAVYVTLSTLLLVMQRTVTVTAGRVDGGVSRGLGR